MATTEPRIAPVTGEGSAGLSQSQLRRNIFRMIWPVTIESILQMTVGFVSTAMVGRLGATVILAVGLSSRVTWVVWALISAIGTGATILVARAIGAGDESRLKKLAQQALLATIWVSAVVTVLAFIFASPVLRLFGAAPDVIATGVIYLRILAFSMPLQAFYLVVSALLRGAGNTRTPMLIAFVINGVNAALNYVLIFGLFGLPGLGFAGSAIATVLAQLVGAILSARYICRPSAGFMIRLSERVTADLQTIKKLVGLGLPSTAESFFWQAAAIVLTVLVNSYGTVAGAAHQLGMQAEGLSYMPAAGFSVAAMAFVGQCLGAGDLRLAQRYVKEITLWVTGLTAVTASILFFFPAGVMRILTNDAAVVTLGSKYLILMAVAQVPQQVAGVINGTLRGAGDTQAPMWVSGIGIWAIRIPLSFLLTRYFNMGVVGVWWAMSIDMIARFVMIGWRFLTGRWKEIRL